MYRIWKGGSLMANGSRKTDRRSVYTRMIIKDSLLALLTKQDYGQLTVADVCRAAEISRSTFYRHYDNLRQVIDELFADVRERIVNPDYSAGTGEEESPRHLCIFLRKNRKYLPLFLSPHFQAEAVNWFVSNEVKLRGWLKSEGESLEKEELRTIMLFQLNGCLALIRENLDASDADWERIKNSVDAFMKHGLAAPSEK